MNIQNVNLLIAHLKNLEHKPNFNDCDANNHFNVNRYFSDCGTPCCIAGHAVFLLSDLICKDINHELSYFTTAKFFLDINEDQAKRLFEPDSEKLVWSSITPQHAAKTLQNLVNTGTVDWNVK